MKDFNTTCRRCPQPRHPYTTLGGNEKLSPYCAFHMELERIYKADNRISRRQNRGSASYLVRSMKTYVTAKAAAKAKELSKELAKDQAPETEE